MNLTNNIFLKNVVVLMGGTVGAQLIILLSSPLLTRLFSPESFGLLAIFMAFVSSFLPCATGRYEFASLLPKSNKLAMDIFIVGIWFSLITFFLILLCVIIFEDWILIWMKEPRLKEWLVYIPVVILTIGLYNAFTYLSNRTMHYHYISVSKFIKSIALVLISIVLGLYGQNFYGLLLAQIISPLFALMYIVYMHKDDLKGATWKFNARKKILAKKYKDYPLFNALPSILNGVTLALPVLYITYYFSLEELGYFALVLRVVRSPMALIAEAVGRVNMKRIVDLIHLKQNPVLHILKLSVVLFFISLLPALILGFYGPIIFSYVFGENWTRAGSLAQIIAFAMSIRFVASTLSSSIGATNNSHLSAIWRIIALICTAGALIIFGPFESIEKTLIILVLNDIIIYGLFFGFIIKAVKNPRLN